MDRILDYLQQLELSEIEAKLYMMLLKTGPISIRELAKKIVIKRTTAYLYVDQLVDKGLAIKIVKGTKKQVAPTEPKNLETLIDQKLAAIQSLKKTFPELVRELHHAFPTFQEVSAFEMKYHKGIHGIEKIYEEALQAKELRSYIKLVEIKDIFPENVRLFNQAFKQNERLQVKEIFYESSFARNEAKQIAKNKRYRYKFMPSGMNLTSEDILIFDGKVAIIHYRNEGNSHSIILQNMDYYNNSREIFDCMWKMLPEITNQTNRLF